VEAENKENMGMVMSDSYFVLINDLDKDIKVGVPEIFTGKAGLEVDEISFYVDGFEIGNAGFGRASPSERSWELTYTFNGAGKGRKLAAIAKANGETVCVCNRVFDVAAKVEVKPKPTASIEIDDSSIQHIARWNNKLVGLVVHYSAGRQIEDATGLLELGVKNGYTYWGLNSKGVFYKTHELNEFGYHVGMYRHKNHLGVEVMCPGKLTEKNGEYYPWYDLKTPWPKDEIRYFEGSKTQVRGHYAKFTPEQERALVTLVQYLKNNCPEFKIENVVDHSECMAEIGLYGQKQDVGGSLSMSMPAFREHLKKVIV
jgi:hypothetical protein